MDMLQLLANILCQIVFWKEVELQIATSNKILSKHCPVDIQYQFRGNILYFLEQTPPTNKHRPRLAAGGKLSCNANKCQVPGEGVTSFMRMCISILLTAPVDAYSAWRKNGDMPNDMANDKSIIHITATVHSSCSFLSPASRISSCAMIGD